jgi:hypothetical protein
MMTAAVVTGFAQETQAPQGPPDPGHGVVRISIINGDVSVRRGDSGEWVAAVANAPVMQGDHIATAVNARAELQFDSANFLRLGAGTEVQLPQMEPNRYQVQIPRGTVDFSVLRQMNVDIELDTPLVSVRPHDRGNYRITVADDGQSEITVRSGQVEVYTPRGVEAVPVGKTMMVRGDPANPEYQVVAAIGLDDWDRWNADRDRRLDAAGQQVYNRYVSPDVYGSESLEGYGRWTYAPDYGWVWSPQVAAGWAPYRDGRWAWDDYYGWNWISYDPWGWAPYHYGRWFFNTGYGGWCWWPGPIRARHYWAPAYVGFFGFGGGGFGVGFGFGNVGWVPLAPFETFHAWWGRGFYGRNAFVGRTTVVNNFNIYNSYRNARVFNGVTAVNSRDFSAGRFGNHVSPGQGELRSAGMVQGRLGITPSVRNMHFSDRGATTVPNSNPNQRFYSRSQGGFVSTRGSSMQPQRGMTGSQPAMGSRGPSAGGRGSAMQPSNGGSNSWRRFGNSPAGSAGMQAQRGGAPSGAASPRDPAGSSNGWRRFGAPGGQSQGAPAPANGFSRGSNGQSGGGWQRFGSPGNGGAPRSQYAPNSNSGNRMQVSPPMVRERNSTPQYSRPSNGGSYNSPPQRSYPSNGNGGGRNYSPSPSPRNYSPSPSYGGGGGRSYSPSPSYGGGGGRGYSPSPSYGGGGRSYGGSSGGGGRSYGGGGGGGHSSGGSGGHSSGGHSGRR